MIIVFFYYYYSEVVFIRSGLRLLDLPKKKKKKHLWMAWFTDNSWPVFFLLGRVLRFSWKICRFLLRSLPTDVQRSSSGTQERWVTALKITDCDLHTVIQKTALSLWETWPIYHLTPFQFQHGGWLGFVSLICGIKRPMQVLHMVTERFSKAF